MFLPSLLALALFFASWLGTDFSKGHIHPYWLSSTMKATDLPMKYECFSLLLNSMIQAAANSLHCDLLICIFGYTHLVYVILYFWTLRMSILTIYKWGEEHAETAESAALVGPHAHNAHAGIQHHVIGHRTAELRFQVLNGAAAIIYGNKVLLALIWVLHLVLEEAKVYLQGWTNL